LHARFVIIVLCLTPSMHLLFTEVVVSMQLVSVQGFSCLLSSVVKLHDVQKIKTKKPSYR